MSDWLSMASDYRLRAATHRPTDPVALQREVRRLRAAGLKPRDIAQALRLGIGQVLAMIKGEAA